MENIGSILHGYIREFKEGIVSSYTLGLLLIIFGLRYLFTKNDSKTEEERQAIRISRIFGVCMFIAGVFGLISAVGKTLN